MNKKQTKSVLVTLPQTYSYCSFHKESSAVLQTVYGSSINYEPNIDRIFMQY